MDNFIQKLGLHPLVAIGMIGVDMMLFASDAVPAIGWGISSLVGLVLMIPCILLQRFGYKDSWMVAIGKGIIVGTLTAIPTPLPAIITGAGGVLGTIGTFRDMLKGGKTEQLPEPKDDQKE
jgi:hypothetical protein